MVNFSQYQGYSNGILENCGHNIHEQYSRHANILTTCTDNSRAIVVAETPLPNVTEDKQLLNIVNVIDKKHTDTKKEFDINFANPNDPNQEKYFKSILGGGASTQKKDNDYDYYSDCYDYYVGSCASDYRQAEKEKRDHELYIAIKRYLFEKKGTESYNKISNIIKEKKAVIDNAWAKEMEKQRNEHAERIQKVQEKRALISGPGVSGLENMGNTCYMNADLQFFAHIPQIYQYLVNKNFIPALKEKYITTISKEENLSKSVGEITMTGTLLYEEAPFLDFVSKTFCAKLCDVVTYLGEYNSRVRPKSIREHIKTLNNIFESNEQQDSQELLIFLINKLHEEIAPLKVDNPPSEIKELIEKQVREFKQKLISQKLVVEAQTNQDIDNTIFNSFCETWARHWITEYSPVTEYLTGVAATIVKCTICNNQTVRPEIITSLSLSMPSTDCTIEELLKREYGTIEELNGDNRYSCDTCGCKTDAIKWSKIILPPPILIVMLKRFSFSEDAKGDWVLKKIDSMVTYPIFDLNINIATINDSALSFVHNLNSESNVICGYNYNLCSVIKHIGNTMNCGHYTSICKNFRNDKWYNFNDEYVNYIPDEVLEKALIHKDSYMLVYSSITKKEEL